MQVLGFGDNIVDRFVDRGIAYPGGNSVNFAVFARQLGIEASYLGVFGTDPAGEFLRRAVAEQGVDISRSVVREGLSGVSTLTVVDGDRIFGGWNGGGVTVHEPLELDDGLLSYAGGFDLVHTSVYSATESQLPLLRTTPALVSIDLSSEDEFRTPEYLDRVAPYADLVLLSCSHLTLRQTRAVLADAVARGAGLAVGTRGIRGAIVFDGRDHVTAPAQPILDSSTIIDTMGCGDAFITAFAISLLRSGWTRKTRPWVGALDTALRDGAGFAARQCLVEGAFGNGVDASIVPATM